MKGRLVVVCLREGLCLLFLFVTLGAAAAQSLIVENGVLIDGRGGPAVSESVVVIEGDRIKAVGRKGQVQYPAQASVIDASGKFVLPGFVESHTHYYHWFGELYLNHGITTAYDLGNIGEWIKAQQKGVALGRIAGPRLYFVGYSLDGGTNDPDRAPERSDISVRTAEDADRAVEQQAAFGADGIKAKANLSRETLKAVVAAAARHNLPVAIHIGDDPDFLTAREAVEIGVTNLVHVGGVAASMIRDPATMEQFKRERLPISEGGGDAWHLIKPADMDEFVKLLVSKNVYINPTGTSVWRSVNPLEPQFAREIETLFSNPRLSYIPPTSWYEPPRADIPYLAHWLAGSWASTPRNDMFTDEELTRLERNFKAYQLFLRKFAEAGGKILPGADPAGSGVPAIGFHHELEMLTDAGIPPMKVISGATAWSAEYLRHGKDIGTVESGKLADLVILRGDPLADIRNTKKIDTVVIGGKVVPLGYRSDYYNPLPRPPERLPNRSSVQSVGFRMAPPDATEGSPDLQLTVNSRGRLWKSATVYFDDVPLETRWTSPGTLVATVPARLLEAPHTYRVRINYPGPSGGFSPPRFFIVGFK
jgi:imidazolonepropionase-like amidohydrolase